MSQSMEQRITDHLNQTYEPHEDRQTAELEKYLARRVAKHIAEKYPGIKWIVRCDIDGKMMIIQAPMISSEKGYHLALNKYTVGELEDRAAMACSEILEKYSIPRKRTITEEVAFALPRMEDTRPDEADDKKMGVETDKSTKRVHVN